MTPEQMTKLEQITLRIVDVVIREADPAGWPGAHLSHAKRDSITARALHEAKRQASDTLKVLGRLQMTIGQARALGANGVPEEPELDDLREQIASAEAEAEALIARMREGNRFPDERPAEPVSDEERAARIRAARDVIAEPHRRPASRRALAIEEPGTGDGGLPERRPQ